MTTSLRKIQRAHIAFMVQFKFINDFLNPFLLLQFAVTTLMLVVLYYMVTMDWFLDSEKHDTLFVIEFRTYCLILSVVYVVITCEVLAEPVSIIYSYYGI